MVKATADAEADWPGAIINPQSHAIIDTPFPLPLLLVTSLRQEYRAVSQGTTTIALTHTNHHGSPYTAAGHSRRRR